MQRTNEIKTALETLQQPVAPPPPQQVIAPLPAPPVAKESTTKLSDALWRIIPASIAFGIALGAAMAYFVLK
jgi:hypothetical protein